MQKKFFMAGLLCPLLVFVFELSSCASYATWGAFAPAPANEISSPSISVAKTGAAESTVILFVFGNTSYPPIATAAKAGDITKVTSVEYYSKPGFLFLWTTYTTIVTGE